MKMELLLLVTYSAYKKLQWMTQYCFIYYLELRWFVLGVIHISTPFCICSALGRYQWTRIIEVLWNPCWNFMKPYYYNYTIVASIGSSVVKARNYCAGVLRFEFHLQRGVLNKVKNDLLFQNCCDITKVLAQIYENFYYRPPLPPACWSVRITAALHAKCHKILLSDLRTPHSVLRAIWSI